MLAGIGAASFAESTVVPIPIETVLIPVSQLRRDKIWHIATVATLGCIVGALLGYAIGLWVFNLFESQIISLFGDQATFDDIMWRMNTEGFWFIVLAGIAPIPLQLAMIAAGASGYPFGWYLVPSKLHQAFAKPFAVGSLAAFAIFEPSSNTIVPEVFISS